MFLFLFYIEKDTLYELHVTTNIQICSSVHIVFHILGALNENLIFRNNWIFHVVHFV